MQVNILTDPDVGGTFISWSLYYLTGHKEFFNVAAQIYEPLVDNPLTKYNSHGHRANHPLHLKYILELPTSPKDRLDIFYVHQLGDYYTKEHNQEAFDHLISMTDKNIIVTNNTVRYWHWTDTRRRTGQSRLPVILRSLNVSNLDLSTTWDKREFIAEYFKNEHEDMEVSNFIKNYDETMYYIDVADLWQYLDDIIADLISWIGYKFDKSRFDHWFKIYNKWRKINMKRFKFDWYLDEIIESIVTNKYIDLMRFNLDFLQECVILHILMKKHNLNLHAKGLEYFSNTKQLHSLLKPYKE